MCLGLRLACGKPDVLRAWATIGGSSKDLSLRENERNQNTKNKTKSA